MINRNGLILHADAWRVIIATGLTDASDNRKTGDMIQIWILGRRESPTEAIRLGTDRRICGDCPLRGIGGRERGCYVNVGQAPLSVWRAWERGSYATWNGDTSVFANRKVRLGAYGDPVYLPLPKLGAIARASAGWTGYTHQWRNPLFGAYRRFLMASCETARDARQAWRAGWRTFRIADEGGRGEILCPSDRGVPCADCTLCQGAERKARSIFIPAHGTGENFARAYALGA